MRPPGFDRARAAAPWPGSVADVNDELQRLRADYPAIAGRFAIGAAPHCPNGATSRSDRAISAKFPRNFVQISAESPDRARARP
jgi:hypothetical protein